MEFHQKEKAPTTADAFYFIIKKTIV